MNIFARSNYNIFCNFMEIFHCVDIKSTYTFNDNYLFCHFNYKFQAAFTTCGFVCPG